MRVVIADDSAIVREELQRMLSELPMKIELLGQAEDAVSATHMIRELTPDTVILDIRMPRGTGINVLRTVKSEAPDTTVIMFTNYPQPEYREACAVAGADFFLDKSADFDKLAGILRELGRKAGAPTP